MTAEQALERPAGERVRVVRIIARLNIGGPAIQAITLTDRLTEKGYCTTLVRGLEAPDEGTMDHLAAQLGVRPMQVRWLRRNPGWHDLPALAALVRIIRRQSPQIVHTHAAKGGALGRVAALIASIGRRSKPILIHTYHGHSLTGYFSPRTASVYRTIERLLARRTDRLIAVSTEVRDELVRLRVAPTSQFDVVPLGFDLTPFLLDGTKRELVRASLRSEFGIEPQARVVTLVARLVPIKRVDRFLRAMQDLRDLPEVRFMIVGDGELRESLQASPEAQSLQEKLIWTGFRRDMPAVCFASDVVTLTSDNEGTPVSLIEAQAAGVPVVTTRVGGAASVVEHGETGFLVAPDDAEALTEAVRTLCADPSVAADLGRHGRARSQQLFGLDRLVNDVDRVYQRARGERV